MNSGILKTRTEKVMISTVSKHVVFLFLALTSVVYGATDEEVADRLDAPIKELRKQYILKNIADIPPLSAPTLVGLTDAEKIRGMLCWIKRIEGKEQHYAIGHATALISNDPNFIKDTSEIRRLLSTTEDLNSFYLLVRISDKFCTRGEDFVVEQSRMLFRHGRVAYQVSDDGYSSTLYDVSAFTYKSILGTLRYRKAPFDERTMMPHQGMIPTDQKIEILVKWLRENWPGCEKLGLEESPARPVNDKKSESKAASNQAPRRKPLPASEPNSANSSTNLSVWLGVGLISLIVLVGGSVYYNQRRKKRHD